MTKLLITSSNTWCTYPVDDLYTHSSTGDKNEVAPSVSFKHKRKIGFNHFFLICNYFSLEMYLVMLYRRRLFDWACEENYMA
jgi:hypothetical protein